MTLEDFFDAIPNSEEVDKEYATMVFMRMISLKKLIKDSLDIDDPIIEVNAGGRVMLTPHPLFGLIKTEENAVRHGLRELNLTPSARKSLRITDLDDDMPELNM